MTKRQRISSVLKTAGILLAAFVTAPIWIPLALFAFAVLWPFVEQWAECGKEWEESERRYAESLDGESSPSATQEAT